MKLSLRNLLGSVKASTQGRRTRRICFLYYHHFSALVYREAKALREKGFDIDIICLRPLKKGNISQRLDGLKLYFIQSRPGVEKTSKMYFLRLGVFFLKSFFFLTILHLTRKYDVIHVTAPPDVMVFASIVPKILGAKIILDIHDIGPELYMRKLGLAENQPVIKLLKYLEKASVAFADHVITVTHPWMQRLVSRSVPKTKCTVLLNVPDENLFRAFPPNRQLGSDSFNLYYHGSLEEHFGVDTLLKAMPIVKKHIPNMILNIYGSKEGRLMSHLKALKQKLNMDSFVKFHDGVPFYKIREILRDADIGIVPTKGSVFSNEAVSMKSLEYISLGIPIVISRTTAHSYYYDSSMVKFFEPDNHGDLARRVVELWSKPDEREELIVNAQEFLKKNGWKVYREKYYQIVEELLHSEQ